MQRCVLASLADIAEGLDLADDVDVVIVCDPNGFDAAQAAASLDGVRTAVFVGHLDDPAAIAFAQEMFPEVTKPAHSSE